MRRSLKAALGSLAVLACAGLAHLGSAEGLQGVILSAAFRGQTDTAWAPGYSGWAFRGLGVGDSQAQVLTKLGEPLEKSERIYDGRRTIYWKYTVSPTKSHYHMRWILFDASGRIEAKVSEFYVD